GNTPVAAGTATKRGYCMAQFSNWVRPGYVRVDAIKQPVTNVFVSAYKKGDDVVIVAVNKTTSSKTLTLSIPGTKVTKWDQYTTSASKNIAKSNSITAGTSFQVTLDAASVTTFNGIAPTVTGLEETDNSINTEVYPNPFYSEGVQINKSGNFTYSIKDMGGVIMESGQGQNKQTVGMKLVTGVYLLSLEQNGIVTTHKIVRK
ncbi:MAG: T9SS type A sorting domain-containing protein, partial [Opitutaceae bacterium]|nr:T9SS type A sorting domain-containing protein [Cytophagales bacterium]